MTDERKAALKKLPPLEDVKITLQYCLETFRETCDCGTCDPCTTGQSDILRALRQINSIQAALEVKA